MSAFFHALIAFLSERIFLLSISLGALLKTIKNKSRKVTHITAGSSACPHEVKQAQTEVAAFKSLTVTSTAHALASQ
jgi:hypothetical protein